MTDIDKDLYSVKITTRQGIMIKTLFTLISSHVTEINICIDPEKITINYYENLSIRICVELNDSEHGFSDGGEYYCETPVKIGVNVANVAQMLKSVTAKDSITMYVEKSLSPHLDNKFGFIVNSFDSNTSTNYEISTIDVNNDDFDIEDEIYPYEIRMQSVGLNKIISNLKQSGGDTVNIIFNKGELDFIAKGDKSKISSRCRDIEDLKLNDPANKYKKVDIISIYVKLQKLLDIIKNTSLSPSMTLMLENDRLVILHYKIATLGYIKIGLAPVNKPDNF